MALLFMDGFDIGDYAIKGWTAVQFGSATSSGGSVVTGRVSGSAAQATLVGITSQNADYRFTKTFTAVNELTIGIAVKLSAHNNNGGFYVSLLGDASATQHLTFSSHPTTRVLRLQLGSPTTGTQIASSTTTLVLDAWYYFEIKANIADSPSGNCVVRMNGSSTPIINYTSSDTKNAGTATTIDAVRFGVYTTTSGTNTAQFDDFYMLDNTGSANTTFLGDVRIASLLPNGAGVDTQLTPTGSATNWQNVDETTYSTADYNGSATVGQRDTYTLADLPGTVTTVHALQSNIIAAKSDVTTANARIPIRTGGTLYYGQTAALGTSYLTYSDAYNVNPNTTVAWTPANVNNLETGMEVA